MDACAATKTFKVSFYHVATPTFYDGDTGRHMRVVLATRTAAIRVIDEATWRALLRQDVEQLSNSQLQDLTKIELLVPIDENELYTIISQNKKAITAARDLRLVVHPTAKCQFACGYCGQEHKNKWLVREHQDKFISNAQTRLRTGRYESLWVCWFGAEPLLGMSVIRSMTPRLRDGAAELGCTYGASVITNGLALTEHVADELVKQYGVKQIHITLDGPQATHDARRPTKKGKSKGTFDVILRNLTRVANHSDLAVEIFVRTNVDSRNHEVVVPLLQQLADAGLQDRVAFYVAPIHSWGNDAHDLALPPAEFAALEISWFTEMMRLGFNPGLLPIRVKRTCVAVGKDDLVIDANGELFSCTEASYVPEYGTPNRYAIGHIDTGEVPGRRNLLASFNDDVAQGHYPCARCRMLPVCGGACPKLWIENQLPCPSTKWNIEARLLLSHAAARLPKADHENLPANVSAPQLPSLSTTGPA